MVGAGREERGEEGGGIEREERVYGEYEQGGRR